MTILSIALSSFRLHLIEKVVDGVLKGIQLPNKIIINVSKEGFYLDEGIKKEDLQKIVDDYEDNWWVSRTQRFSIEFNYVKNIGPMRAYLPVVEMYKDKPDTTIIILDDDLGISENTISDLVHYCEELDSAVGLMGYTVVRGKYFFGGTEWSYLIKEPKKVHVHYAGWCTTFKIRHLHKSILDWRKYEDLGLRYDNEPYLAYMFAKQGTDRYVIPSEKIQMYTSESNLHDDPKSRSVKEKQFRKFYRTISGDDLELTGREIIYGKEEI